MLRALPLVALLLLAGCAGPAAPDAAPAEATPTAAPADAWVVTATRVEADPYPINWTGQVAARPCAPDGTEECRGPVVIQSDLTAGVSWDEPSLPLRDPAALFWRVALRLSWWSQNPTTPDLELDVVALPAPGCDVCKERVVATFDGPSPIRIDPLDVFLEDGEEGVALVVRAADGALMESSWGAASVRFQADGVVAGYHAAGEPILLS